MRSFVRYVPIALHLARTSITAQAQYRLDFLLQLAMGIFWVGWNVAPVWIIFDIRPTVAGWDRQQAMVVMSAFLILRAMIEGIVSPNLSTLVTHIRFGTFDFMLLKPIDTQLLASFSRINPSKLIDFLAGLGIAAWAIAGLEPRPGLAQIGLGAGMLACGAITIYSIWLLISCTAFYFVKVDNLAYLFTSVFDAARWPIAMFRGWVRAVLTFVIPVAIMTSYPALALLGLLEPANAALAWGAGLGLLALSRAVWRGSLRRYSSASS